MSVAIIIIVTSVNIFKSFTYNTKLVLTVVKINLTRTSCNAKLRYIAKYTKNVPFLNICHSTSCVTHILSFIPDVIANLPTQDLYWSAFRGSIIRPQPSDKRQWSSWNVSGPSRVGKCIFLALHRRLGLETTFVQFAPKIKICVACRGASSLKMRYIKPWASKQIIIWFACFIYAVQHEAGEFTS